MKQLVWIACSVGSVLAGAASAQLNSASALQRGREVYASACAACHGGDGRGRSQSQLGFATPLPDFTNCDFAAREPDADWEAIIHDGGPVRGFDSMMPAFGDALDRQQIADVLLRVRAFCIDAGWPRGDLNLPRALLTEKAFPEDEAVIDASFVTEGNDAMTYRFIWEQRFGSRNQIEVGLPLSRADTGMDGWRSAAGDLAIGVKHVLRHDMDSGWILSVGGEVVLPTGDETHGFGTGSVVYETYLAYGKLLSNNRFVQAQAVGEFPSAASLDDELVIRAALGQTWTADGPYGRSWTPMLEIQRSSELRSGTSATWDLLPQLQVSLSTRQHILANIGLRIPATDRSERPTELVLYLLWDWFDGGVREGW